METGTTDDPGRLAGRALAAWRRGRCVELARAGLPYEEIARSVGYRNRSSAWRAVQAALAARIVDDAEGLRAEELARLEQVNAAYWERALNGDLGAAHAVLRASVARTRLLGLDQPATSTEAR